MSACTSSAVAAHAAAAVSSAGRPSRSAQQRCLAQRSSHASKVSVRSLPMTSRFLSLLSNVVSLTWVPRACIGLI